MPLRQSHLRVVAFDPFYPADLPSPRAGDFRARAMTSICASGTPASAAHQRVLLAATQRPLSAQAEIAR
jgi:hypothetical protein